MFGLISKKKLGQIMEEATVEIDKLRKEVDHWKYEAGIWKNLYDKELRK